MSKNTDATVENIIPIPTEAPSVEGTDSRPQTIQELVANIDIAGVSEHKIIVDLISGIQQLALRGTIALGLLERIKVRDEAGADAEAPAENADAESSK